MGERAIRRFLVREEEVWRVFSFFSRRKSKKKTQRKKLINSNSFSLSLSLKNKNENRWTQFRVLLKRGVLAQLRNPTDATSRLLLATWVGMLAGLTFFNLGPGAESVQKRLGLLFFTLLLFELLPFCYMSFYVEDRRFFAADVASDLYHPSAYYVATVRDFFFF